MTSSGLIARQRARLESLAGSYMSLEARYCDVGLRTKRELEYDYPVERFYAAAILGPRVVGRSNRFHGPDDYRELLPRVSEYYRQEQAPLAAKWFDEIFSAHEDVKKLEASYDKTVYMGLAVKLHRQEWKYKQLDVMLTKVINTFHPFNDPPMSELEMVAWQKLCEDVSTGHGIEATIDVARRWLREQREQCGPSHEHVRQRGEKFWFEIDCSGPAWPSADPEPKFEDVPPPIYTPPRFNPYDPNTYIFREPMGAGYTSHAYGDSSQQGYSHAQTRWSFHSQYSSGGTYFAEGQGDYQHRSPPSTQWGNFGGYRENGREQPRNVPPTAASRPAETFPAPKIDWKRCFEQYDQMFSSLSPLDKVIPVPSPNGNDDGFKQRSAIPYDQAKVGQWQPNEVTETIVKLFFAGAFGVIIQIVYNGNKVKVKVASTNSKDAVDRLGSQLKRELMRWHPDKLSKRTGQEGVLDEALGKEFGVVAIRAGIQDLKEACSDFTNGPNKWVADK